MSEIKEILFREDFPVVGETYKVGEVDGRYFFAWGHIYPYSPRVPKRDIRDGENGIQWFDTETEALEAFLDAVEAVYDSGLAPPTEKVMTAVEARERWGVDVQQSCRKGKLKKYIESGHVRKSGGLWLVSEYAMRDAYGEPKK